MAPVIFYILSRFHNRDILGRGQKGWLLASGVDRSRKAFFCLGSRLNWGLFYAALQCVLGDPQPSSTKPLTLQEVQCTVVLAVGNSYFDAYVLSESMTPLIFYAHTHLGLTLSSCHYTRWTSITPLHRQSKPITSRNTKVQIQRKKHRKGKIDMLPRSQNRSME